MFRRKIELCDNNIMLEGMQDSMKDEYIALIKMD